jgi:hypothetical protein
MQGTEAKSCENLEPHGPHHTIQNVYQDGAFHHMEEVWCDGVVDPEKLAEARTSFKGAIAQVLEMDEAHLDEILEPTLEHDAAERRQAEREVAEYMARQPQHIDMSDIRAKDPELQAKMDAYEAQAKRLQHQAYLQQLREAAEKGEIKQYPNRAQRRANAKAFRKEQK